MDTEACVLKTTVDLFETNYNMEILNNLCASSGKRKYHEEGLNLIKRGIGINNVV